MLNFVIGFFVGMLTLYIGFNIYARYQIHKMFKDTFGDMDFDEIMKHINENNDYDEIDNVISINKK